MRARRRKAKPKKKPSYAETQKKEMAILRKERQAMKAKKEKSKKY